MTRVLLTGASGCLGHHLLHAVPATCAVLPAYRSRPIDHTDAIALDLTDAAATHAALAAADADVVIHTAYGAGDPARDVTLATQNLVAAAVAAGVRRFVYVSSDMVFDGRGGPYAEDDPTTATSDYGRAKIAAEAAVRSAYADAVIARCSLIVAREPVNPSSAWVLDALRAGKPIQLFTDEYRSPIMAADLAAALWELASRPAAAVAGVWHLAGPEHLSRFAIGLLLARSFGLDAAPMQPRRVADSPSPRPADLRLHTARQQAQLTHVCHSLSAALCPPATCRGTAL